MKFTWFNLMPWPAAQWARLIPGARVDVVVDAGHMLPYEQPEAFVRAVTAFIG